MTQTQDLRTTARALFDRAVSRADPARATERAMVAHPPPPPGPGGHHIVIALGKAAPLMMRAALARLGGQPDALCITHHENTTDCPGATVMRCGHPVPDAAGLKAAHAVIALLQGARVEDRVVALISGGGSALLPAPAPGLDLDQKIALNQALLASGLDIVAMNTIRQQVSQLKGGGMLRLAAPARVTGYVLSDVIGDDLRAISSGPTVAPIGTRADAATALRDAGLWDGLPPPLRAHLSAPDDPAPLPQADNHLIGSNGQSLAAAAENTPGFTARVVSDRLVGDVADAAAAIHAAAGAVALDAQPTALFWGGETTVRLTGTGLGGRNQELALRLAALCEADPLPRRWLFLSGGTDGRDGPTDAAGAMVDAGTWARIRAAGGDPDALLANNDSHAALRLSGDLLFTGATGTNVADIQILLSAPA